MIHVRENWYRDVWLLCVTALVLLALSRAHDNVRTNCQQIELVKSGLRATLQESERFSASSPVRPPNERARIANFYKDALARETPRRCR